MTTKELKKKLGDKFSADIRMISTWDENYAFLYTTKEKRQYVVLYIFDGVDTYNAVINYTENYPEEILLADQKEIDSSSFIFFDMIDKYEATA